MRNNRCTQSLLTKGAIKLASRTTFLCRCKPFKELSSFMPPQPGEPEFFAKAGAKVSTFREPTKYFRNFFSEK